jgi:cytidyltransferase-like protein
MIMGRVMLMGTFDPLHDGHRHFFATARESGSELYVGVMSDQFVREIKNREPVYDEQSRLDAVLREGAVDFGFIVPRDEQEEIAKIISFRPDVYYFGSATYDGPWNKMLQGVLKEHLPNIEFKVIAAYDRQRLNSTSIRAEMRDGARKRNK